MPGPLARASRHGGDATLLVAAAIAAATSYTTIYTDFNAVVVVAGCVALAALVALRLTPQVPSRASLCLALLIGLIPQWWRPPIGNVDRGPLFPLATGLGMLASVLLVAGALVVARRRFLLGALAYLSASTAAVLIVQASARPAIDVWIIFQQATRGLLGGGNPYEMAFSGVPAGQTDDCFNYLPFTLLASLPGRVALGDVRYGELLVLLAGSAMLGWRVFRAGHPRAGAAPPGLAGRASLALLLVVMTVSLPGTLRITQQAWNESVVLGCLLAAVALLLSDRAGLAVVPLALALATKQHVLLVLPGVIALVAYGVYLGRRFLLAATQRDLWGEVPAWVVRAMLALTVFLVLLFVFAAVARYADAHGRTVAQNTVRELEKRTTSVTIYSAKRLFIQAPGVQEAQLRGADTAYKYRYSGLRLLAWSNDRYFLLPEGWSSADQVTIILPDSDTLRVEFTHGTR